MPLDDLRMPTLMGNYRVPHLDTKGEANHFFTELGVPVTFLYTSFYWENFIHFGLGPKRGDDGKLYLTLPMGDKKLPGIAGEHLSGAQMAAALGRSLGEEVIYNAVEPEVFRSFGFLGAEDLGNMFQFKRDFEADFCGMRNPAVARALNPALQDFDDWLALHGKSIPLE